MPTVANGIDLDWAFSAAQTGERRSLSCSTSWTFRNARACRGYSSTAITRTWVIIERRCRRTWREPIPTPTITTHMSILARLKYGFGYNTEQELTANLGDVCAVRLVLRSSTNHYAYTEVDQTVEAGAEYFGNRWHRPNDKVAIAVVSNAIKRDHQNCLRLGGLGFQAWRRLARSSGRENIVESYYTWHAWKVYVLFSETYSISTIRDITAIADPYGWVPRACTWTSRAVSKPL